MGLLHKALSREERRAGLPEMAGTGLFAKALLSRDRAALSPEEGPAEAKQAPEQRKSARNGPSRTETQDRKAGLLAKAGAAPAQSDKHLDAERIDRYPLSIAGMSSLRAEMRNCSAGPDSLFAAFCHIAEKLPLSGLALYTAYDGFLRLCALIGFEADKNALIEEGELKKLGGKPFDPSPYIKPKAGAPSFKLRYVQLKSGALWIYGDPRLDAAPEKVQETVGDIFRSIPEGGPYPAPSYEAAGKHTPLGKQWTTACLLDVAELPPGKKPLSWLTEYGRATTLRSGAEYVLGEEGWALLAGDALMLALIYSRQKTDEVLALYQLRKSLARALPSFRDSELPNGKALAIEGDGQAAEDALRRFIGQ